MRRPGFGSALPLAQRNERFRRPRAPAPPRRDQILEFEIAEDPVAAQDHRADDHRAEEEAGEAEHLGQLHAEDFGAVLDRAGDLVAERDRERADDHPRDRARTAKDHHRHRQEGLVEVEAVRPDHPQIGGVHHPAKRDDHRRERPGEVAQPGDRHPHGACGEHVLARGAQLQPGGAVAEQLRDEDHHRRDHRAGGERGDHRDPVERALPAGEVDPGGEDHIGDDEQRKGQDLGGGAADADDQIAGQPAKHEHDRKRDPGRDDDRHRCLREAEGGVGNERHLQRGGDRQDRGDIARDPHEGDVTERDHPGIAHEDLHAKRQHEVHQEGIGEAHLIGLGEQADGEGEQHEHADRQGRAARGGEDMGGHVSLSPSSTVRPSRPAGKRTSVSPTTAKTIASR
ncbi:hypothetical protein SDC9_36501 [bioreactor metagenome]|uniref:Uncharacterized protein n=1 Tax=bioreactor metagenome TaxID=1076179 RepID=A0A644VGQ2_9ZZZZ